MGGSLQSILLWFSHVCDKFRKRQKNEKKKNASFVKKHLKRLISSGTLILQSSVPGTINEYTSILNEYILAINEYNLP